MPGKGTTRRTVRIDDALWEAAQEAAQANGDNLSEVIRRALTEYVNQLCVVCGEPTKRSTAHWACERHLLEGG